VYPKNKTKKQKKTKSLTKIKMASLIDDMADVSGDEGEEEEDDFYDYGDDEEYEFIPHKPFGKREESPATQLKRDRERAEKERQKLLKEQQTKQPLSQEVDKYVSALKEQPRGRTHPREVWTEEKKQAWQKKLPVRANKLWKKRKMPSLTTVNTAQKSSLSLERGKKNAVAMMMNAAAKKKKKKVIVSGTTSRFTGQETVSNNFLPIEPYGKGPTGSYGDDLYGSNEPYGNEPYGNDPYGNDPYNASSSGNFTT
jgi:hypothetical protein